MSTQNMRPPQQQSLERVNGNIDILIRKYLKIFLKKI